VKGNTTITSESEELSGSSSHVRHAAKDGEGNHYGCHGGGTGFRKRGVVEDLDEGVTAELSNPIVIKLQRLSTNPVGVESTLSTSPTV
jgi:hypothetical protein